MRSCVAAASMIFLPVENALLQTLYAQMRTEEESFRAKDESSSPGKAVLADKLGGDLDLLAVRSLGQVKRAEHKRFARRQFR